MLRGPVLAAMLFGMIACNSDEKPHPDPLYMAIPDSSLECLNRLLLELQHEFTFNFSLAELAVPPPGGVNLKHMLQVNSDSENEQKQIVAELLLSQCLPKHASVYKTDDNTAAARIIDQINSRAADETVYLDLVDGEIHVYLHRPASSEESVRYIEISKDEAKSMGLPH